MSISTRVRLSIQKAILGQITPEMEVISVEYSPAVIRARFYLSSPLNADDKDECDDEVVYCLELDFPSYSDISCIFEVVEPSQGLTPVGDVVFCRKGVTFRVEPQANTA